MQWLYALLAQNGCSACSLRSNHHVYLACWPICYLHSSDLLPEISGDLFVTHYKWSTLFWKENSQYLISKVNRNIIVPMNLHRFKSCMLIWHGVCSKFLSKWHLIQVVQFMLQSSIYSSILVKEEGSNRWSSCFQHVITVLLLFTVHFGIFDISVFFPSAASGCLIGLDMLFLY